MTQCYSHHPPSVPHSEMASISFQTAAKDQQQNSNRQYSHGNDCYNEWDKYTCSLQRQMQAVSKLDACAVRLVTCTFASSRSSLCGRRALNQMHTHLSTMAHTNNFIDNQHEAKYELFMRFGSRIISSEHKLHMKSEKSALSPLSIFSCKSCKFLRQSPFL